MERFSQRESILLGYNSPERSYSPKRNLEMNFHDVFGGPPRRSSIQEMRYSVSELQELSGGAQSQREDASCPWLPVFGEENATRRRYPGSGNNFYDDIFGGEESLSFTPRKHERDIFSAASSTRLLSPALPLPPKEDPVSPSTLPAQFSLPAKLTNGMDLPTFGSITTRSLRYNTKNMKDNKEPTSSNGFSSSSYEPPNQQLSRVSSHVTRHTEVFNNDLRPPYRQSILSRDLSESHNITDKEKGSSLVRQKSSSSEVLPASSGKFHFSMYKWACNAVPLVMPLRTDRNSRSKHKPSTQRCSSAKEWIIRDSDVTTQNDGALPYTDSGSFLTKKEDVSTSFSTQNGALQRNVQDTTSAKPQSEASSSIPNIINDFASINVVSNDTRVTKSSAHSVQEMDFSGKTKQDSVHAKPASKPLLSLFTENDKQELDCDEITERGKGKESKVKGTNKSSVIDFPANQNKPLKTVENEATSRGSNTSLDENGRVQGKVKEFVRLLNQEASMKPRLEARSPILGSENKQRGALRTRNTVEDYPEQPEKENCAIGSTNMSGNNLPQQDDISASGKSAVPDSSVPTAEDKDGSLHVNFLVKELDQDECEALQVRNNQEIQVIDAKIQQWSKGKEGNIRSLLSTLQYVLWPESGWKPVPLVNIIEGNAVKRAYQRALLCLHPDKLQQKGAASHQKYIAEKTFDILQEAWTHFNMLGAP